MPTDDAQKSTICGFDLEQARSAILHGAIWDGFNGPDGVSKDEALEYAAELFSYIDSLRSQITNLEYELGEARTEIGHHHADFQRINKAFDDFDGNAFDICRVVRGIVE